jgi:Domain of unknown function (DUF1918)
VVQDVRAVAHSEESDREASMARTIHGEPARPGDEIVVVGHAVGQAQRTAVIEEVLGDAGHERFRVRWEDGHESVLSPGDDAIVQRPQQRGERARAKRRG